MNRALLRVSATSLADALGLPIGHRIVSAIGPMERGEIAIILEGPSLPAHSGIGPVPEVVCTNSAAQPLMEFVPVKERH